MPGPRRVGSAPEVHGARCCSGRDWVATREVFRAKSEGHMAPRREPSDLNNAADRALNKRQGWIHKLRERELRCWRM